MKVIKTCLKRALSAGTKFGRIVGGIAIQMKQAILGCVGVNAGDCSLGSIENDFGAVLDTYCHSFSGKSRSALSTASTTAPGMPKMPSLQAGRPQTLRLRSNVEIRSGRNQVPVGEKRKRGQTCVFAGHWIISGKPFVQL